MYQVRLSMNYESISKCIILNGTCTWCGRRDKYGEVAMCPIVRNKKKSPKRDIKFPDYEYECFYCGFLYDKDKIIQFKWKTKDHVIPKSKGGKNNKENIVLCCYNCNLQKGSLMPNSFLMSGYLNEDRINIVKRKLNKMGLL